MLDRWRSTVRGLSESRSATPSLSRPSATRARTARSRPVRAASGSRGRGRSRKRSRCATNCCQAGSSGPRMWLRPSSGTNCAPRDEAGQSPSLLERRGGVLTHMQHQRGHPHLRRETLNVDLVGGLSDPGRGIGVGRTPLHLVEGIDLLRRGVGHEHAGEHPAKAGVVPSPADPGQLDEKPLLMLRRRVPRPRRATASVAAIEDEAAHTTGVTCGVDDADRTTTGDPEQIEVLQASPVDHRCQVLDSRLQRHVCGTAVRQPTAAHVVTHQAATAREVGEPVLIDGDVVLQVCQPRGRPHQRRTFPRTIPGDADPVRGNRKPDPITHRQRIRTSATPAPSARLRTARRRHASASPYPSTLGRARRAGAPANKHSPCQRLESRRSGGPRGTRTPDIRGVNATL